MAKATTRSWTKLSIWPGDGASPEVFTSKVCGLTSKGFSLSSDVTESNVPDCDDPDLPSWVERVTKSNSAEISGSGVMAEETFAFWRNWKLDGSAKNVRVVLDLATNAGYFSGSFLLTNFDLTGNEDDGKVNVTLTLQSSGEVEWTTS